MGCQNAVVNVALQYFFAKGERLIANGNIGNGMIKVYTSNRDIEFAEVRYSKCMLIDYDGNEHMILDYFGKKSLYKLRQDDAGRVEFIYVDKINKIDVEKERRKIGDIRGF